MGFSAQETRSHEECQPIILVCSPFPLNSGFLSFLLRSLPHVTGNYHLFLRFISFRGSNEMVKSKERKRLGFNEVSNSNFDIDLHGDDGWVVVKKQKVTVLVPPPPTAKALPGSDPEKSQPRYLTLPPNIRSEKSNGTCLKKPPSSRNQQNGLVLAHTRGTRLSRKAPPLQHFSALAKSLTQDRRIIEPRNLSRDDSGLKSQNVVRLSSASKFIEQSWNQQLRALNLERKLQKAGGLSRWLASLGLDQFVRFFQRKSISKFHLVNMTMKKLKDMGANAVGPRRKLMHAIDCICQPYCFESS